MAATYLVAALQRLIADLSSRLGKPVRFVPHWNAGDLPNAYRGVLREALTRFARNSMTHGVETEAERRRIGKSVPAILQFALRRHLQEGQLEVVFQDDGRGLDLERIRERARQRFGLADVDDLHDSELAQFIFEPGFSTADEVTGDAGRGVGLDLVRGKVESLGGVIRVHSEPGVDDAGGASPRPAGIDVRHAHPLARATIPARRRTAHGEGGGMSSRSILPQAVYRRAKEPHDLPADLRMTAIEWALYFALTGTHTVAEVGRWMRVERGERDAGIAQLLELGLIVEQSLDASEYVRALAAAGDREARTLREFLVGSAQPESQTRPQRPDVTTATIPVQRLDARTARTPSPPLAFTPLPLPERPTDERTDKRTEERPQERKEDRTMSGSRKLSLRALMNLIEKRAGSREAGQLDVYRVFVRIDTILLKRSGIETLRFTEDRLVSDPELEQAIVRSVKKTLGLDCPENVWVEVA